MKKYLTIAFAMLLNMGTLSAQVTTYGNGHVGINRTLNYGYSRLVVGDNADLPSSSYTTDIYSSNIYPTAGQFNLGLTSEIYFLTPNSGRAVGVRGLAANATDGYNYGVLGGIYGTRDGAGVLGVDASNNLNYMLGKNVIGIYAGYFVGETRVEGTFTATTINTPSDMRLKKDIVPLNTVADEPSTLDNVLNMNVFSYSYIENTEVPAAEKDTISEQYLPKKGLSSKRHFGLSAQELQTIYPDLVTEGQDGYLAVNYVELVPILIQSIQDLKSELDELRGERIGRNSTSALYQSASDFSTGQTAIRFQLPDDVTTAFIRIFDLQGKLVKQIPINSGQKSISFSNQELGSGVYLYSLVANGKEVATKRMKISN